MFVYVIVFVLSLTFTLAQASQEIISSQNNSVLISGQPITFLVLSSTAGYSVPDPYQPSTAAIKIVPDGSTYYFPLDQITEWLKLLERYEKETENRM